MDLDPIGVVPSEVPDDYMVAAMLPELATTEDVFRMHVADQLFKKLEAQRKSQNARLIALEKAWAERKDYFRPDLLRILGEQPDHKVSTLLATTYVRSKPTDEKVEVTDDAVAAQFLWLRTNLEPYQNKLWDEKTGEVLVEFKPHVTAAGKQKLLDAARHEIATGGPSGEGVLPSDYPNLVPGCTYVPPRDVVVTRSRGEPLSMEQLKAIDVTDLLPRYIETAVQRTRLSEDDDPSLSETV